MFFLRFSTRPQAAVVFLLFCTGVAPLPVFFSRAFTERARLQQFLKRFRALFPRRALAGLSLSGTELALSSPAPHARPPRFSCVCWTVTFTCCGKRSSPEARQPPWGVFRGTGFVICCLFALLLRPQAALALLLCSSRSPLPPVARTALRTHQPLRPWPCIEGLFSHNRTGAFRACSARKNTKALASPSAYIACSRLVLRIGLRSHASWGP